MKNFQIWEDESNQESKGMLILGDDIYKIVDLTHFSGMEIKGVSTDLIDTLNNTIKSLEDHIDSVTEMEEFLRDQNIEFRCVEWLTDMPTHDTVLCFDTNEQNFFDLSDYDDTDAYDWWNGSNHKTETAHDGITVTIVDTEDDPCMDLDEWNHKCNGFCTGGQQFYHEVVYKILLLDGQEVKDTYLLRGFPNWQGSHPTGAVMSKNELDTHLEEIGYNVD